MTGLGHSASVAAMIAAASSSVGAGDIINPVGGGNISNDTLVMVLASPARSEAVVSRLGRRSAVFGGPGLALASDHDGAGESIVECSALGVCEGHQIPEEKHWRDHVTAEHPQSGPSLIDEGSIDPVHHGGPRDAVADPLAVFGDCSGTEHEDDQHAEQADRTSEERDRHAVTELSDQQAGDDREGDDDGVDDDTEGSLTECGERRVELQARTDLDDDPRRGRRSGEIAGIGQLVADCGCTRVRRTGCIARVRVLVGAEASKDVREIVVGPNRFLGGR